MIITTKKIVIAVFIVLFLLAISPYSNAQEEVAVPTDASVTATTGEVSREETIYSVQDLAANAATKLRTAISHTEQILGRLYSRGEKVITSEGYYPTDDEKQLVIEATQH